MEKYLVTIEFRYSDAPKYEGDKFPQHMSKKITIGVFDTRDVANEAGNMLLEILENRFELHKFPSGLFAERKRFSNNGGCFGYPKDLITNLAYLKTPFEFYTKITKLKYDDIRQAISEVLEATSRYKEYKTEQQCGE